MCKSIRRPASAAFTLVEVLAAIAVFSFLTVLLAALLTQTLQTWSQGNSDNDYRERARDALNFISRDLSLCTLAVNQPQLSAATKPTLELLVDPVGITSYPDAFFFQAPVATDTGSSGNLAEVGYFIRWINGHGTLCRFFVNPSDTANYQIYSADGNGGWLNSSLLNTVAPADAADFYRGMFLHDVLGLWVQVYPAPSDSPEAYTKPFDSSHASDAEHPLPAYATISIATLDAPSAARLQKAYGAASVPPAPLQSLYSNPSVVDAQHFVAALHGNAQLAAMIGRGAEAYSLRVRFNNYHTFSTP